MNTTTPTPSEAQQPVKVSGPPSIIYLQYYGDQDPRDAEDAINGFGAFLMRRGIDTEPLFKNHDRLLGATIREIENLERDGQRDVERMRKALEAIAGKPSDYSTWWRIEARNALSEPIAAETKE